MRFPFLIILTYLIAALSGEACRAERPHIVLLYADDMGYGDLSVQNPESKFVTPHLDRLAQAGMRLTDAHSSSGICTPSRYALLTGQFHWRKFHNIVNSFDAPVLDEDELTIAELLQQRGYHTACIGKWHLGWNWQDIQQPGAKLQPLPNSNKQAYLPTAFDWSKPISGGPLSHGFHDYFGDDVPNFPPYAWFRNDRVVTDPSQNLRITPETAEGSWEARPGPMTPDWDFYAVIPRLTEEAVQWIGTRKALTQPFFLYVPFNSPHAPIVPSSKFQGRSEVGGYGDFMLQTDDKVGQILQALEENDLTKNTLVIFTSDNGPERYAYERVRNFGHRSAGPLRGLKRDLYEGGHRVPMLIRWPGKVPAGTVHHGLVSQVDLFATLAAVAGAEIPAQAALDSYNLLEVFTRQQPSPRQEIVHNTFADAYAIRQGNWVLINHPSGAHTRIPAWFAEQEGYVPHDHPAELYDLENDLGQLNNLYDSHPEQVRKLQERLVTLRQQGQVRSK